jgi:hypothetical protein
MLPLLPGRQLLQMVLPHMLQVLQPLGLAGASFWQGGA